MEIAQLDSLQERHISGWRKAACPGSTIAAGNFLVGDFPAAAFIYDRQDAPIEVSRAHGENVVKNMVAVLIEERLGLAVEAPGALVYGPFAKPYPSIKG